VPRMDKIVLFAKLLPFGGFLYWGTVSILEAFFPSLRDPDFNRWEVDEESGNYIQILGWKKVLTPPRVIAQGYMSDSAACAVAVAIGTFSIAIALAGIRHILGFPQFLPDPLKNF